VSSGPQLIPTASRPAETQERNWLPLLVAAAVVLVVAGVLVFVLEHGKTVKTVTPISATADAYAASLPLSSLAMSESANLAGGKVTYLDGHITNSGARTVTGITVQVLFRSYTHEVAQNETQPLKLIRIREPYIDLAPISADPLTPGAQKDFRLIFDAVSPDWDQAMPEIRVIKVDAK
jgi:hypothetical protein